MLAWLASLPIFPPVDSSNPPLIFEAKRMSQATADNLTSPPKTPTPIDQIPGTPREAWNARLNSLGPRNVSVERVLANERADRGHDHEDDFEQRFRFLGVEAERDLWLSILPTLEPKLSIRNRFDDCGTRCSVYLDTETNRYVLKPQTCKLRFCPVCRRRIQRAVVKRLSEALGEIKRHTWQFITLTIRHTDRPLADQLSDLRSDFRKLRQHKLWKEAVSHGFAIIEITYNEEADQWHPHIHVLAHTGFIDWGMLRQAWKHVTSGSDNIDCGFIQSSRSAATYVAKYLGKPPPLIFLERLHRAAEYYNATKRAKFLIPFGVHPKRPEQLKLEHPQHLLFLGSLHQIHLDARNGNSEAHAHLKRLNAQNHADTAFYLQHLSVPTDPTTTPRPPPDAYRTIEATEGTPPF